MRRWLITAAAAIPLASCSGIQGPRPIITPTGFAPDIRADPMSMISRFRRAAERLYGVTTNFREITVTGRFSDHGPVPITVKIEYPSHASLTDPQRISEFLDSGFALIDGNCQQFFDAMGNNQTQARVIRDLVVPVVTVLTGIITLRDFTNAATEQDLLQQLGLGTGLTVAALDVYDTHFLFGAENLDAVRELTMKALVEHRNAAQRLPIANADQASVHLLSNQAICTPQHIRRLAREAIANARLEARVSGDQGDARELDWRRSLGHAIGLSESVPVTREQAYGLWALYTQGVTADTAYFYLRSLTGTATPLATDAAGLPKSPASINSTWPHVDGVQRLLEQIPAATLTAFRAQHALDRATPSRVASLTAPPPTIVEDRGPSGFQRVEVAVPR